MRSAWDHTMDPWMDAAHRGTPVPDTVVQRREDAPERPRESARVRAPGASLRGDEMETDETPTFKGFEDKRYQEHDKLVEKLVTEFNKNKKSWVKATAEQVKGIPDLDAALMKSWLIQEAGGNDDRSQAAWSADPAQVNVPGDWNEYKADLGLKEPKRRNEGTLEQNMKAAIIYLARKGFGGSGQPPENRPEGTFDGWKKALQRYNGRTDEAENGKKYSENYADRIVKRADNPDKKHEIELPKSK